MAELATVSAIFSIPALVDLSIGLGKDLVDKFKSFRCYGSEVAELVLVVENHWFRLEYEMKFVASLENCLENNLKDHFERLSNLLYSKFQSLQLKINEYSRKEKVMYKLKFVFCKRLLREAISVFENRHLILKDLICTLALNPDEIVDQKIKAQPAGSTQTISMVKNLRQTFEMQKVKKRVGSDQVDFKTDDSYWQNRQAIKYTTAKIQEAPGSTHQLIIDTIPCSPPDRSQRVQDVRQLALVLKSVTPSSFGILSCAGIVEVPDAEGKTRAIEMVFNIPSELGAPRSLRSLLMNHQNGPKYPIDARIDLAKQLARTVLYVHTANFVHKNFRPETIIIFDSCNKTISPTIGFPFLVGFQKSRPAVGGVTYCMGDTEWEQNIYRHPERQGEFHETTYQMEHDVYSLGVCLLEIALWKPFVVRDEHGQPVKSELSRTLLEPAEDGAEVRAEKIKARLVQMAENTIPQSLGSRYTDVTISCLTCLDYRYDDGDANTLSGEEGGGAGNVLNPLRETDTTVGASYIEKILGKLEEISV